MVTYSDKKTKDGMRYQWYVSRDGYRVSENNYDTKEEAQYEYDYWKKLTDNYDNASVVKIDEIDPKKGKY